MEITEEVTPTELTKDEIASLLSLKSSLGNEDVNAVSLAGQVNDNVRSKFDDVVNKFTSYESKHNTELVKRKIRSLLSEETILNPDNPREAIHAVYHLASIINKYIKKITSVYNRTDGDSSFTLLTIPDIDQEVVIYGNIVRIRDLTPSEIVENPDISGELKELMSNLISNDISVQRNINRFIHYISGKQHDMSDYELNIPATTPTLDNIISIYTDIYRVLDFLHRNVTELTNTLILVSKQHTKLINNVYIPMYAAGDRLFNGDFIND